jgi:hypothetical protein
MRRQFTILILLFFFVNASGQAVSRLKEEKAYAQAIKEYLDATHKRDGSVFDTLLIGKRPDFPEISLPARVGNTVIMLLTTKEVDKKRKQNKKLVFVNLIGTVTNELADFMVVTFYPGYTHQYDCIIGLKYNGTSHIFQRDYVHFKNYAYK